MENLVLTDNIRIHFKLPFRERGQSKDLRLVRELWFYLRPGYYRLCEDGQLVNGQSPAYKALDMPIHTFVIDAIEDIEAVANYISKPLPSGLTTLSSLHLEEVHVIPVSFYNIHDWRDGDFGLVCYAGQATHLVRLDGEFSMMSVADSAQAGAKLLLE